VIAELISFAPFSVAWSAYDVVLERCVSTSRGLYAQAILNSWGIITIQQLRDRSVCADKLLTQPRAGADITFRSPATRVAFTPEKHHAGD